VDIGVRSPARPGPPSGDLIKTRTVRRSGTEKKNVPRHRVNDDVGHHMVGLAGFEPTTSSPPEKTRRSPSARTTQFHEALLACRPISSCLIRPHSVPSGRGL